MTLANYIPPLKNITGSIWLRLSGYTPIFSASLLAMIAKLDNVTGKKGQNKRHHFDILSA